MPITYGSSTSWVLQKLSRRIYVHKGYIFACHCLDQLSLVRADGTLFLDTDELSQFFNLKHEIC